MYLPSVSWHITPLEYFSLKIIYLSQKDPIKGKILLLSSVGWKFAKFSKSFFKAQFSLSSSFASFFSVMTHNSSAHFWFKHNSPNSSCHIWNHNSVFLWTSHHFLVSWEITLLHFSGWNFILFGQKEPIKVKSLRLLTAHVRFHQICTLISSFC